MTTVRDFLTRSYRLISAANPTQPLHGDDLTLAITVLNQLLQSYASTGLLLTIAKTVSTSVTSGITDVFFTGADYSTTTTLRETVTLTTGSPAFTVADPTLYAVGDAVAGAGIPSGSTILTIVGTVVTISANATITGSSAIYVTQDTAESNVIYLREGRLANLDNAWLLLEGVTYPLIIEQRSDFLSSFKYDPLSGLPRFAIVYPETEGTRVRIYPKPSQQYEFFVRGKFQLVELDSNDDMSLVPQYYQRFLQFAVAKDVAMYKGRSEAWTPRLEEMYQAAMDNMVNTSEINVAIEGDRASMLNGAWRVRAGI